MEASLFEALPFRLLFPALPARLARTEVRHLVAQRSHRREFVAHVFFGFI